MRPAALTRKLLRDVRQRLGQALAIAVVLAAGVATFVMSLSMLDSLAATLEAYYARSRFAHVFASLERAPGAIADRLNDIDGVSVVQERIVQGVLLDMPGLETPALARVVSLPESPTEGLNLVHVRQGRWPAPAMPNSEVLVSEKFAREHRLRPGSSISAILNGRLQILRVSGLALSPEYIYLIAPGSVLPENERFGVLWMPHLDAQAAFDMRGAFNDVVVRLAPGAHERDVIDQVDRVLDPYGSLGAFGREHQPSHQFVDNELRELRGMAVFVPVIFLGVAAFLMHVVFSRFVTAQRQQAATLKALGYPTRAVAGHYVAFALTISIAGAALGVGLGAWMGRGMTALYAEYFNFPHFGYRLRSSIAVVAVVVGLLASLVGVLPALRGILRLPPAEAMRPPSPPTYRAGPLTHPRLRRLWARLLGPGSRMVARSMRHRPLKTALTLLTLALATSILVVAHTTMDAVDFMIETTFHHAQRYDLDVALHDHADIRARAEVAALPGVRAVDAYRAVPVRIPHANERTVVRALQSDDGLLRLIDIDGRHVRLPTGPGVVVASSLAQRLGAVPGDMLRLEVLTGRRAAIDLPIAGLTIDASGTAIYARLEDFTHAIGEPNTLGGLYIQCEPGHRSPVAARLRESPGVAAVNDKASTLRSFQETVARSMGIVQGVIALLAGAIAVGVVYNTASVSLAERTRDLATMRVIGFTRREVALVQLGELVLLLLASLPIGLLLGVGLSYAVHRGTQSDLFRMPFILRSGTLAWSALGVLAAGLACAAVVAARMQTMDHMDALKAMD